MPDTDRRSSQRPDEAAAVVEPRGGGRRASDAAAAPARVLRDLLVCENTIVRLPPRLRCLWLALALGVVAALWWLPRPDPGPVPTLKGRVVGVVDDETLRVEIDGTEELVRYIAIGPHPAAGRAGGAAAAVSRELAEGRMVQLELDALRRDAEGRLLAYVHVGGTMLNAELVRRGRALVVAMPPNIRHDVRLLELQREAREGRRGLWAPRRRGPVSVD